MIIPKIFESFLTRIHFEYLINGASVLAGVSMSTTGGAGSIMSPILVFFDNPSLICEIIPESEIIPTILFSLKIGMTQKELANQVGVSTSMINQIESGRSAPSYETAKKIFEVLEKQEREAAGEKGNAGELCTQKIF